MANSCVLLDDGDENLSNLYILLEVEKGASHQDIKSSYNKDYLKSRYAEIKNFFNDLI